VKNPARARLAHSLNWRFRWLRDALDEAQTRNQQDIGQRLAHVETALAEERQVAARRHEVMTAELARLQALVGEVSEDDEPGSRSLQEIAERSQALLQAIVADEPANRRRLWALRESAAYEAAYEAEPLVTVSVVTRDRADLLLERSLPSVLGQSYERLEILVVGDDASEAVQSGLRSVRDPRLRFINLTTRVVRKQPADHWLAAATLARNEAYRVACGQWTMDFDDDDSLLPTAIESLVALARREHPEVAYGLFDQHAPDGTIQTLGGFPPRFGDFSLAAALVHAGLRFFTRELHTVDLGLPGDWHRTERMLRAGVRFARIEQPIFDYYPATLWRGADKGAEA